ncbi:MAG: hypothetical protein JSS93_03480 [Bacteroidetes bacterium]|nr:hypothetical protein [Bacteroidota bacterium]
MAWTELLVAFILNPIRFPVGLLRLWLMKENRKKSFGQLLSEYEVREICLHGTNSFLQLIAAIGILLMLGLIVATFISIFRFGFTH